MMSDIKTEIQELGLRFFDQVGFADACIPPTIDLYRNWLDEGLHGEMSYLVRHLDKKTDPKLLLNNAKSWIVLTLNYDTKEPLSIELQDECRRDKKGWIARYARGRDYHDEIRDRHDELIKLLKKEFPGEEFLGCVDTKAVLERDTAARAGVGWIGKNTCLISKDKGSFMFLSEILTTLEILPDKAVMDHCGTCTRCIDACPTQALVEPHKLDATKCISYWTIESKTPAPESLSQKFGANIFGCDICQDVCPWNQHSRKRYRVPISVTLHEKPALLNNYEKSAKMNLVPVGESGLVELQSLLLKGENEIKLMLQAKAINRTKPKKFIVNAEVALSNLK
jgi:epoxyqueuosine reductase